MDRTLGRLRRTARRAVAAGRLVERSLRREGLGPMIARVRRRLAARRLRPPARAHRPQTIAVATKAIERMAAGLPAAHPRALSPDEHAVAVVVPAFNGARYLEDCLESVRQQTHQTWRCYVVDDASDDDTASVIAAAVERDDRFVALRHGRNSGLSASRNTGLLAADESLVAFLDADDLLVPSSLERRIAAYIAAEAAGCAGSWGATPMVPEETALDAAAAGDRPSPGTTVHAASSNGECPFNAHAPLLRTELLRAVGGFDETLRHGAEDWDLWHRLLRHGFHIVPTGWVTGLYRQRATSMARADQHRHLGVADSLLAAAHQPARVDPGVAVDPAGALPFGELSLRAARVRRFGISAGIRLAATGDLTVLDGLPFEMLDGAPTAVLLGGDLHQAVRAGMQRGLGLGTAADVLARPARDQLALVVDRVVDRIAERAAPTQPVTADDAIDLVDRVDVDVVVVAANSADVARLLPALDALRSERTVAVLDIESAEGASGAGAAWEAAGLDPVPYNHLRLGRVRTGAVVAHRPLGPVMLDVVEAVRSAGGAVVTVGDPDRPVMLDCNDERSFSADHHVPDADPATIVDALARTGPPARLRGLRGFADRLIVEEGDLDAASVDLLRSLHDRHVGEVAVIIGNGPSLNETDLSLLDRARTIGVNAIFLAGERLPGPLDYFVVEDTSVFRENTEAIKAFDAETKLFPTMYRSSFTADELTRQRVGFFRMNAGFYGRGTGTLCHPRFSTDASQRVFCGQSVTIINLQLAHWMGFDRVVLIGMDFSYTIPDDVERKGDVLTSTSDDVNHFHADYFGAGKTWKDPKLDRVLANYALAGEIFAADGREIVNATVGGRLDLFRRLDLVAALDLDQ